MHLDVSMLITYVELPSSPFSEQSHILVGGATFWEVMNLSMKSLKTIWGRLWKCTSASFPFSGVMKDVHSSTSRWVPWFCVFALNPKWSSGAVLLGWSEGETSFIGTAPCLRSRPAVITVPLSHIRKGHQRFNLSCYKCVFIWICGGLYLMS